MSALATYQDLCIDAVDDVGMGRFWSSALGLAAERRGEDVWLSGPTTQHRVWINKVAEPVEVKQRVHIDVHTRSIADLVTLGASVLDDTQRWTVLRDPEAGEVCAFVRDLVPAYKLYEIVVDCVDGRALANWWGEVFGATPQHDDEHGFSWLERIPEAPFEALVFVPVPEPKTVKNRIHWDVETASLDGLIAHGARILRERDDEIRWTVMADPEGNEFCAFTP